MRLFTAAFAALSVASAVLGQATSAAQSQTQAQSQSQGGNSQSNTAAASGTSAAQASVVTSFSVGVSISGTARAIVTVSVPIPVTIQPSAAVTAPAGNGTAPAGNATIGTATTSSTPVTYPYASATLDAGAQGGATAPSPGSSSNPAYGPDDSYIAGARQLAVGGVTLALGLGIAIFAQAA